MKTKKLLMLLVAMLLSSVSAFAQSNEPLSGDVNGDNKVDVADIVAIISALAQSTEPQNGDVNGDNKVDANDIMAIITIMKNGGGTAGATTYYFYAGTTKPTSLSQAQTVTSYPTEQTYTNNSGAKSHIFVLTNSDKNVTFIEPSENSPITQASVDTTTISGYKIFETAVGVANTKQVKIRISDSNN